MYCQPVKEGRISSGYGLRHTPKKQFHYGIDIVKNKDPYIYMPCDGIVVIAGYSASYGYRVWVEITNGAYKNNYLVLAHLSELNAYKIGDVLSMGSIIGKIGNTGMSVGEHLHLGIKKFIQLAETEINCINPKLITILYDYKNDIH